MSHDQTITNPVATAAELAPPSNDTAELPARRVRSRTRSTVPVAEAGPQPQCIRPTPTPAPLIDDSMLPGCLVSLRSWFSHPRAVVGDAGSD